MDYQQTIDYLFNQLPVFQIIGPGAYKPGLHTARLLADAFDNPQNSFRTIHVGGTNGKGSTSHSLASVLAEAGYKVGLYTSPHIFDFRERIRINGEKISEDAVVDFVQRYQQLDLDCQPSFFELTTIMAFDYFKTQNVDIAVIEVGLGGRLDTTNIITPLVSVITNVSLDHTAQLGHTEAEIAAEKAGIIKSGIPVVIGESDGDVREVFARAASKSGSSIIFADDNPYQYVVRNGKYVFYLIGDTSPTAMCDLEGDFQVKNINTVLTALSAIGFADNDAIRRGLANVYGNTHLMGRWTTIKEYGPRVICDTGHNIGAWQYVAPLLSKISKESVLRIVIGFVNDKDITPIFELLPTDAIYYFVTPSVKRGRPSAQLLDLASNRGLKATSYDTVAEGYYKAMEDSSPSDTVFIGGSNYVVADLPLD